MRPALLITLLAFLTAAAPAAASPTAGVRLASCTVRTASFEGDMRTVRGALRLRMRFTLQARDAGESKWRSVAAPGFGASFTSIPGVGRYVYTKTVENLVPPADYRVRVSFRWIGVAGQVVERAKRYSKACRQPDLRPDLVPIGIADDGPGASPGTRMYAVTLRNDGRESAGPFGVALEVGGRVVRLAASTGLAAGATERLVGEARACRPGEQIAIRLDPDGRVDERDEDGNELPATCPTPS